MRAALLLLAAVATFAASKPEFKAGAASIDITPAGPTWMSGYASRTKPSEGVDMPLHAKALAIEDSKRNRVVIITADLVGLPREITDPVSARLGQAHDLRRAQILFNASHTHTGPVVGSNLRTMYTLAGEQRQAVEEYARRLSENLFTVAEAALGKLEPVTLHYGEGQAGFAVNRREFRKDSIVIGVNPMGPVDHKVPVVEFRNAAGKPMALLFGYTCHNTTLGAAMHFSGDYAGAAQRELETRFPGSTALFLLLCGADQNPNPRGKPEHVEAYGGQLADAVSQALAAGNLQPIHAPLRMAFQMVDLAFAPHTREQFEEEAKLQDPFRVRRAKAMLERYDAGQPLRKIPYPVQAIRFHKDLTVLALGGEVVIDYQLRARRQFPGERLIVAGYSNDVMCYIPSLRVLREGGYEADSSMIYYGMPGKFSEDVEETIFDTIRRVMKQVG